MDVSKGGFPLGETNNDFAAKFIWVCAFLFVYSLAINIVRPIKKLLINFVSKHIPSDQIKDDC